MKLSRLLFTKFAYIIKSSKLLKQNVKDVKQNLFTKHLFLTNLTISVGFSGLGDVIEQVFEIFSDYQTEWNKIRTMKLSLTGLTVGVVCHHWYIWLDKYYSCIPKHRAILNKIILSQLVFSPICIIIFFVTLGLANGSNKNEILMNIHEKGKKIYIAEWMIWPPAQLINFYFLPLQYRILYDSVISLGFDVYNSYIVHKEFQKPRKSLIIDGNDK